jgi:hypothetical protein
MLCFRNGSRFKSEGAGQLRVSPTMGWQLTPNATSHDRAKIGQPPRLPQRIMGSGPIGHDATARGQVVLRSSPQGSKPQGAGQRRMAARRSSAGSVSEPARPETAGNTPQGLTSRMMASRPDRESWDLDEEKNPLKPHANP